MKRHPSQAKLNPITERSIKDLSEILKEAIHVGELIIAILVKVDFAKDFRNSEEPIDDKVAFVLNYFFLGMGITANT